MFVSGREASRQKGRWVAGWVGGRLVAVRRSGGLLVGGWPGCGAGGGRVGGWAKRW